MKKNKILIVDDNKLNRQSLADIFRKAYQIVESEDGKKALEYLKKDKGLSVAAIILDLIMPVMDGFAFLEEFKKHSEYKYIPIVIATTEDNVENEKRCLEYGVWDFIPKSFHREIIWFRVMNAIKRSKQHFLEYDSLTGIYNRQMFYQKTREMLDDSKDETFAFIRLDIDRFKMINSFYGAAEGDRLLRCMAHNICGVLSAYKTYTYGRLNSDVFGICVAVEKEQDALLIAQKIREQVKKNGELRCYLETSAGCYIIRDKEMEVSAIYEHPKIVKEEKVKIVEDIFAEKISAEFVGLLRLIVEKGHFAKVDTVLDYFIDCVKEYKNIGTAYVTSAMELSEAQKAAVEKRLLETTKYVKFEMHYAVDSALIGGMVIRIGDRVVDSSVRTKLNDLTRELSKIQLKAGECAS